MAKTPNDADDRVTARLGPVLRDKLTKATENTGQRDSEIVRTALSEFFNKHKTAEAILAAIIKDRQLRRST